MDSDGGMVLHHIINEGRHLQKRLPSFVIGDDRVLELGIYPH